MPVLDSERRIAPRSVLRYRPVNTNPNTNGLVITKARRSYSKAPITIARVLPHNLDLNQASKRTHHHAANSRAQIRTIQRFHPVFFIGLGLLLTILLWIGITRVSDWGASEYNMIVYGYPRSFQIDAVVGHQDSARSPSHFLALNFHGQTEVIEFPGGDATHAHIFLGPQLFGANSDLEPVTLYFVDLNADGKPDMIMEVQGNHFIFLNDHGSFRPLKAEEQNQIMQRLRQLEP